MGEQTKTEPEWVTYRRDYKAFLDAMPSEVMGEAYTVASAAKWRALGVSPYDAAKWASMGCLPTVQVARWVLDGVTPELYLAVDGRVRSEWANHRWGLSDLWRERALRFIDVTDPE